MLCSLYEGPTDALQDFIISLYDTCLPTFELTRRDGCDAERFTPNGTKEDGPPKVIRCEYLIPIRR